MFILPFPELAERVSWYEHVVDYVLLDPSGGYGVPFDTEKARTYLDALNKGVAHALGTSLPGENGHIFLFAHSTDYFWNVGSYNAIFYLLQKLEKGDQVNIFYRGVRYVYYVTGSTVVDPSQVEYLTRKSNKEFLTLQTCWPPGTTLKRLLVFASPASK